MTEKLIAEGILRPSGEISQDKINLLSGAYVSPLVEMLWTATGGDKDTADEGADRGPAGRVEGETAPGAGQGEQKGGYGKGVTSGQCGQR